MTIVHVTFPVLRGAHRFTIQRGRRWSVIEHLLLDAVARKPASAPVLAEQSGLPRRVVVEALIRLMRAGWIEIAIKERVLVFGATAAGAGQAAKDQLPAATTTQARWRAFAIEQMTGGVFRDRELDLRGPAHLPVAGDEQLVAAVEGSLLPGQDHLHDIFMAIEGEDERIVGIERAPDKLLRRDAVVTVRDAQITGLPGRASPLLRAAILAQAERALRSAKAGGNRAVAAAVPVPAQPAAAKTGPLLSRPALYETDDLIIDGEAQRKALHRIIGHARERLIIHSTFINDDAAGALLPWLFQAADRGTVIDLLWGQDEVGGATAPSFVAAERLRKKIVDAGRSEVMRIHPLSTNSHAKVVIADNGRGDWHALLGSCNWLASDFTSFEASVRLRDPALVGQLIVRLAGLAVGRPGLWTDHAVQMTVLGRQVEARPRGSGRTVPMHLLFSSDHAQLTLQARDSARKRIYVLSHRLGIAGRPVALLPMLSAVKANNIQAVAYYNQTTGALSGAEGADLTRQFAAEGVTIRPIHQPRLHAKVLGWDDDSLAVTSFNWLSADPPAAAACREIGVLIEAPRIAEHFFRVFDNARVD
jgi:phosphatidylserine/phosphatidylglycerophosphate/cardiolipin synthase-like enzyme